ncbi:MAG: IS1380 family transposase [Nitrospinae bacterium]|nr:IS1380 family transposase [Nitrospinota bacterium]
MNPTIFKIKQGDENLSSHSGLALAGALLFKTNLTKKVNQVEIVNKPTISNGDVVKSMIGLCCIGKPDFDAIEPMRGQPFFSQALGVANCPSSPTIRQRLDGAKGQLDRIIKEESALLVKKTASQITPIKTECHGNVCPLDIDVTPHDNSGTKKEGVSCTYKKVDGFAPINAYLGQEGYMVNTELREGKQHCQKGTPEFLAASIAYAKQITNQPILVRLDSGNDSKENIRVCIQGGAEFLIKRNLRKETPDAWLEIAKKNGTPEQVREGKIRWLGEIWIQVDGVDEPVRVVFDVVERTITAKGEALLFPEIEADTYWVSLKDSPKSVVELYHDHGTSEQFHSEIKSDMNLERLPSGKFSTNSFVLLLGLFAYNILRLCGQESLQECPEETRPAWRGKVTRRRVRTVMQDLIYLAGRIVKRSRSFILSFGRYCPWGMVWQRLYKKFSDLPVAVG